MAKKKSVGKNDLVRMDIGKLREDAKIPLEKFLSKKLKEIGENSKRPNILICGYTGVGKTTLLQKIFGEHIISSKKIDHGRPCTKEFRQYQNELVSIYDSAGLEHGQMEKDFKEKTQEFVRSKQDDPNVDEHIHLVWYCIDGPGARVSTCDKSLIRDIFPNVIVVVTKNDFTKEVQRKAIKKRLKNIGVKEKQIVYTSEYDPKSILNLVDLSYEFLPEAYKDAFLSAQMVDLEKKKKKCLMIIHGAAVSAAAVGAANPLPVGDAAIIVPIQGAMIASIGGIFVGLRKEVAKGSLLPVFAKVAGTMAASNLTKLIPGFGQAIQAVVAGAFTETIGRIALNHFEKCAKAKIENKPMPEFVFDKEEFKAIFKSIKLQKKSYK